MRAPLTLRRRDRVLVLAPHPDDETLAASGLLQRATAIGAAVRVVVATDGENNPWPQRLLERRWRVAPADRARWGARRRREVAAALRELDVPPTIVDFLGLPDQGLTDLLIGNSGAAVAALAAAIIDFAPTILVAPSPDDLHPDHNALAVFVRFALDRAPRALSCVLSYVVHGRPCSDDDGRVCGVQLTLGEIARKRAAITAHRTQLPRLRRWLLRFAGTYETFQIVDQTPVPAARLEGATLRMALPRRRLCVVGETTLHVATDGPHGGRRLRATLPCRPGRFPLCEVEARAAGPDGILVGTEHGYQLLLPASIVDGAATAFLKVEHRVGFFDEGGWVPLPVREASRRDVTVPPVAYRHRLLRWPTSGTRVGSSIGRRRLQAPRHEQQIERGEHG